MRWGTEDLGLGDRGWNGAGVGSVTQGPLLPRDRPVPLAGQRSKALSGALLLGQAQAGEQWGVTLCLSPCD